MPTPVRRLLLPLALLALLAQSCREEPDFKSEGVLDFSKDTVQFDSLFQNTQSPTRRLRIYNNTGHAVNIDRVGIQGGEDAPYKLILDGVKGQVHRDVEIREGDSLLAFLDVQADAEGGHRRLLDYLEFEIDANTQRVPLETFVLNAYLFRDSTLSCNTTLPSDTLIVVDGSMKVDTGCTATIPAGARLYFTPRHSQGQVFQSGIEVYGSLTINGQIGNEVVLTNNRLDEGFDDAPGQWAGIYFGQSSTNNLVRNAIIQNGTYGVLVDSVPTNNQIKLVIENTIVRNMSNFCLASLARAQGLKAGLNGKISLSATNVLAYNAGQAVVGLLQGGNHQFVNCTFAEYGWDFDRNNPLFIFTNVRRFENEQGQRDFTPYPGSLTAINTIMWGTQDSTEFGTDLETGQFEAPIALEHCLLKTTLEEQLGAPALNNILNQAPQFEEPRPSMNTEPDFQLTAASPAIDAGTDVGFPANDLEDRMRPLGEDYDIGAYEFEPSMD